jgi:hypothetical protein
VPGEMVLPRDPLQSGEAGPDLGWSRPLSDVDVILFDHGVSA